MYGSFARLAELTPEQEKELGGIHDEHERIKRKMRFFELNLRLRLTEMGVPAETVDGILSQPHHRRIELLKETLEKLPLDRVPPGLRGMRQSRDKEPRGDGERRGGKGRRGPGKERRFFHADPDRD
jgi:hypothetical protein